MMGRRVAWWTLLVASAQLWWVPQLRGAAGQMVTTTTASSGTSLIAEAKGRWDFTTSLTDLAGQVGDVAIKNAASRTPAGLVLRAGSWVKSNPADAKVSIPTGAKTIAAWVTLSSLSVTSGAIISVEGTPHRFDAIVFAERQAATWMAGSESFARTKDPTGAGVLQEQAGQKVFVAIVYTSNSISIYRNGARYGGTMTTGQQVFNRGSWWVTFGPRHDQAGSIDGTVHSALLWTRSLSAQEVAAVFGAGSGVPIAPPITSGCQPGKQHHCVCNTTATSTNSCTCDRSRVNASCSTFLAAGFADPCPQLSGMAECRRAASMGCANVITSREPEATATCLHSLVCIPC
jgi:hypothetical protein